MSFSMETEKENKLSSLDVEIVRGQGTFAAKIIKSLLLVAYIGTLKEFSPSIYKFGMVYTSVYRCFRICSNWTQFHTELSFLKWIFQKNGYPENFIDKCFKKFLKNIHLVKKKCTNSRKKAFGPSPSILRDNIFAN